MVHKSGITLNDAINSKITAVSSVGDLLILKDFDSGFYSIDRCTTSFQDAHGHSCCTINLSACSNNLSEWSVPVAEDLPVAGTKVYMFIGSAVVTSTCMNEDRRDSR